MNGAILKFAIITFCNPFFTYFCKVKKVCFVFPIKTKFNWKLKLLYNNVH